MKANEVQTTIIKYLKDKYPHAKVQSGGEHSLLTINVRIRKKVITTIGFEILPDCITMSMMDYWKDPLTVEYSNPKLFSLIDNYVKA